MLRTTVAPLTAGTSCLERVWGLVHLSIRGPTEPLKGLEFRGTVKGFREALTEKGNLPCGHVLRRYSEQAPYLNHSFRSFGR